MARPPSHGAYRTVLDQRTAETRHRFVDLVSDGATDLDGPEAAAVGICADALVRLCDVNAYLDGRSIVDAGGEPLPVMRLYVALVNAAGRAVERVATLAERRSSRRPSAPDLDAYMAAHAEVAAEAALEAAQATIADADDRATADDGGGAHEALAAADDVPSTMPGMAPSDPEDTP